MAGFTPFDTIATGWLTAPELLPVENLFATIGDAADDRAAGRTRPHLHVRPGEGRRVRYISGAAGFGDHVLARMGA